MDYVLKTNSLCKRFYKFKALDGLTMNVPKGSIYGFVGKNGAGKTTLIRLLCGLQPPTSGGFELYGIKTPTGRSRRQGAEWARSLKRPPSTPKCPRATI